MHNAQRTVVVAGGGYSGVLAANRLRGRLRAGERVVLVTPDDALTHRVRLHQMAVHGSEVREPYTRLLAHGVTHIKARAVGLEPNGSGLAIEDANGVRHLSYAALILALGSRLQQTIPSASPLALALLDAEHALQLAAALPRLPAGARVLVVGGGLTAIELSAELAEAFPALRVEVLAWRFADGLTAGAPAARAALLQELAALGVVVREGVRVIGLEADGARLDDGTHVPAAICLLTTGFSATGLGSGFALPTQRDGRVSVDEQLRVIGTSNVFVAGDLAAPPAATIGTGAGGTRMSCATAMPLGAHAADQVGRLLNEQPLQRYSFKYMLQCISIGRQRGVALFVDSDDRPSGRVVRGRAGALIKEGICRMVISALRLERHFTGMYAWPRGGGSAKLDNVSAEQSHS